MPVEDGALGELCIRGPCLMQRYYKRSREECFDADGWLHTGDLAATDNDGFVYYIGRRGSMIKTAGANVSPAEVEKAIAKVTGGAVAHVSGSRTPTAARWSPPSSLRTTAMSSTKQRFGVNSPQNCRPTRFPRRFAGVPYAEMPLLSSGKVDRAAIEKAVRCLTPSTNWCGTVRRTTRPSRW